MTESLLDAKSNSIKAGQPWLSSSRFDLALIIAPAFLTSMIVILFRDKINGYEHLPLIFWVLFVLMIDVAHVYSTLFRTYLDIEAFEKNKTLLILVPLLCWSVGSVLYSIDHLTFWKALAYLAVFHFIRQQFGFVALYGRKESEKFKAFRWVDGLAIYAATIYPILYWHSHMPRNFNWFISGDFFQNLPVLVSDIALYLYAVIIFVYLVKEFWLYRSTKFFNIPRNLILLGTAISWWMGIVFLNSDLAFTMTNVVAHGIPYIALVWLYHHKPKLDKQSRGLVKGVQVARNVLISYLPAFLIFLVALAYLEEGLWDGFIWREHGSIFGIFNHLPELTDPVILAILVPFLALPQSTHYVLDGFIWRIKDKNSIWST